MEVLNKDIIIVRNGNKYIKMDGVFIGANGYLDDDFDSEMEIPSSCGHDFDVMKIFRCNLDGFSFNSLDKVETDTRVFKEIWRRNEYQDEKRKILEGIDKLETKLSVLENCGVKYLNKENE